MRYLNTTNLSRNETRDASVLPKLAMEIKDDGFEFKQQIQKAGYDDRMVTVYSSLLGDTASDSDSFVWRLLK
jgi:hypothetical protein